MNQSRSYFKNLSIKAQENDIIIDIYCGGLKEFHISLLQNLVLYNNGMIIIQKDFGSQEFIENMKIGIQRS